MGIPLSEIRRRILRQQGIEFKKLTRKPVTFDRLPSPYKKSRLMQLIELRHGKRLDDIIFKGTIYEVEKLIGVDASTISKWRKLICEARDKEFFEQFK